MVNNQSQKYTISDLVDILDTPDNVVRKKVKKYKFPTAQEVINSRLTTVVFVTNDELEALIKEVEFNKSKYSSKNNQSINDKEVVINQSQNIVNSKEEPAETMKYYIDQIASTYKLLIEEKDKRVNLLEDFDNRYRSEYFEMKAKVEELQALNNQLKIENEVLKKLKNGWQFWKK